MPITAKGYPYPDPTDPVANTDTAIQALAAAINDNLGISKMRFGSTGVNTDAGGLFTFAHGEATAPTVVLAQVVNTATYICYRPSGTATDITGQIKNPTTGANLVSSSITVRWIAIWA